MLWGGNSKIENDLMGVENARGAEFVKMHSPRAVSLVEMRGRATLGAADLHEPRKIGWL